MHPPPSELETLNTYVKRLAHLYDVSYITFCVNALGGPPTDREARSLRNPSDTVLERLSEGTGVPVVDLRELHPDSLCDRHMHLLQNEGGRIYGREIYRNAKMCKHQKFLK